MLSALFTPRVGAIVAITIALLLTTSSISTSVAGGSGADAFQVDLDPSATPPNSSTNIGSVETCARINNNGLIDADEDGIDALAVDIVVGPSGIPAEHPMVGFGFTLNYPAEVLSITAASANFLLSSGPGSSLTNGNDALPDSDGTWNGAAADTNTGTLGNIPEAGPGVLERITLGLGLNPVPGTYDVTLSDAGHVDPDNAGQAPENLVGATVSIDQQCAESLLGPEPPPASPEFDLLAPAPVTFDFQPSEVPCPIGQLPAPPDIKSAPAVAALGKSECVAVVDRRNLSVGPSGVDGYERLPIAQSGTVPLGGPVPLPGRTEAGAWYRLGELSISQSATYRTYMEVYPRGVGSLVPNNAMLTTATNRIERGAEVLAYYTRGPSQTDIPLVRVFDWSCSQSDPCQGGETSPHYFLDLQLPAVSCWYAMLEDNTGHYVNYMYYRNSSWIVDPGDPPELPPLWRNAVSIFNYCTGQYDGVYSHDYRHNQLDCSVANPETGGSVCVAGQWAGILEVNENLPPSDEMAKIGFHHQSLEYDGQTSHLSPDETTFYSPPEEWELYFLQPNRLYEVGTYQDDDGDGIPNGADLDIDGDGTRNEDEEPCGATLQYNEPRPEWHPYLRPERVDEGNPGTLGYDDDGDTTVDEPLPSGVGNRDCDGDGFSGDVEAHVYSYFSQLNGDQKTCQQYDLSHPNPGAFVKPSKGWPLDFNWSLAPPPSLARVNIMDLASFVAPVRYLNTDVGTHEGDQRWDLVPGRGIFSKDINILDLATVAISKPTIMPQGERAFNGPACRLPPLPPPWP